MPGEMRPGDWICGACGNHNFASRQVCNKCGGPRTDDGSGAGLPSAYGPAYGAAHSAQPSSAMAGPYGRPAYVGGSGSGGAGGPVREMKEGDWMCPSCGNHNFASRVKCNKCNTLREGMKEGDWICRSCKHHNFAKNYSCQKCAAPRTPEGGKCGGGGGGGGKGGGMMMQQNPYAFQMMMQQAYMAGKGGMAFPYGGYGGMPMMMGSGSSSKGMKEGDWMCPACGNHNFASRTNCNKCQALRPGYKHGDWTCQNCRAHNFASRTSCLKCSSPKPETAF